MTRRAASSTMRRTCSRCARRNRHRSRSRSRSESELPRTTKAPAARATGAFGAYGSAEAGGLLRLLDLHLAVTDLEHLLRALLAEHPLRDDVHRVLRVAVLADLVVAGHELELLLLGHGLRVLDPLDPAVEPLERRVADDVDDLLGAGRRVRVRHRRVVRTHVDAVRDRPGEPAVAAELE